jgi:hypothetical protein
MKHAKTARYAPHNIIHCMVLADHVAVQFNYSMSTTEVFIYNEKAFELLRRLEFCINFSNFGFR